MTDTSRIVSAERIINAPAEKIFEFIADPSQQPLWDGNDNLAEAATGQRVKQVGDVFIMKNTNENIRENHVVEFDEAHRIAWKPSPVGEATPGHLWRWELESVSANKTLVRHTYDWTHLTDESRFERARATTEKSLLASIERLAEITEK